MSLFNFQIEKILDMHCIPHYEKNGRIYADDMIAGSAAFEESTDVTGYSKKKLYDWLGY